MRRDDPEELFGRARVGDRAALARLLSLVERGGAEAPEVGRLVFGPSAGSYVLGITGAPGAGKSTLTNGLITQARRQGARVGVLAVDPTSPYTGGAILGDRIRMQDHASDPDVFVRSMATRGHLGGLALAAPQAIRVLGGVGHDWVVVETVGVGQVEVEIAGRADTTVVVVNPRWGDSIQANKAGLLEIADLFVINKADMPGAAETRRDLENMLDMDQETGEWRPPIVETTASDGSGLTALWASINEHRSYLGRSGDLQRRRSRRLVDELSEVLTARVVDWLRRVHGGADFEQARQAVGNAEMDPRTAAEGLLAQLGL